MKKLNINGVLLVDKPIGFSSNQVLQKAKRLFNANKAGHTGSLDPLATGILPICFGEATKFSQHLLDADKAYQVEGILGKKTTTGDAEGEVIVNLDPSGVTQEQLQQTIQEFQGEIEQIPPMFSALKQNGQPLYKLARQGIEVTRAARRITIYSIELNDFTLPKMHLTVHCSKGTYIRTLVEDIGHQLGCEAHVSMLRRIKTGFYQSDESYTLEQLENILAEQGLEGLQSLLLPVDSTIHDWPTVSLSEEEAFYIRRGQEIVMTNVIAENGLVRLVMNGEQFIGVGEVIELNRIAPRRLVNG